MIVTRDRKREHDRPERDEADRGNGVGPIRPEHLEPEHAEQHGKRQQLEGASNRLALSRKTRRQRRCEQTGHQDERHRRRWPPQRAHDADEEQSCKGHQKHADQPRRLGEPQRTIDEKKPRIPEAPVQRRGVRKLAGGHQRGDRFRCARRGWCRIGLIVHRDVVEQRRVADERGNGEQERQGESRGENRIASRTFTSHEEHNAGQEEIQRHEEDSGDVAVYADAQQQAAREQESRIWPLDVCHDTQQPTEEKGERRLKIHRKAAVHEMRRREREQSGRGHREQLPPEQLPAHQVDQHDVDDAGDGHRQTNCRF